MAKKRKPDGYWKLWSNTKTELRRAIRRIGHFPTDSELEDHGMGSLAYAIVHNHGGYHKARERMGYAGGKTPFGYYDDFEKLRPEIEAFIRMNRGKFPTHDDMENSGRYDLISGIRKHNGLTGVREKMGFSPARKSAGYWESPVNIRIEADRVMKKEGVNVLPGKKTLSKKGYYALAKAITKNYPGGFKGYRRDTDHSRHLLYKPPEKTRDMYVVEKRIGEPVETYLAREYRARGSYTIARDLNLCDTTVLSWLDHFGLRKKQSSAA